MTYDEILQGIRDYDEWSKEEDDSDSGDSDDDEPSPSLNKGKLFTT